MTCSRQCYKLIKCSGVNCYLRMITTGSPGPFTGASSHHFDHRSQLAPSLSAATKGGFIQPGQARPQLLLSHITAANNPAYKLMVLTVAEKCRSLNLVFDSRRRHPAKSNTLRLQLVQAPQNFTFSGLRNPDFFCDSQIWSELLRVFCVAHADHVHSFTQGVCN